MNRGKATSIWAAILAAVVVSIICPCVALAEESKAPLSTGPATLHEGEVITLQRKISGWQTSTVCGWEHADYKCRVKRYWATWTETVYIELVWKEVRGVNTRIVQVWNAEGFELPGYASYSGDSIRIYQFPGMFPQVYWFSNWRRIQ